MDSVATKVILLIIFLFICYIIKGKKFDSDRNAKKNPQSSAPNNTKANSRKTTSDIPKLVTGSAKVLDGDSLFIDSYHIRLFGVDAPELNHPYGRIAKAKLAAIIKGEEVYAEIKAKDRFDRLVCLCRLRDGRDLSAEMVKMGMALDWKKYSGGIYRTLETPDARRKLWLADARQKGRMDIWVKFEAQQRQDRSGVI